MKNDNLSNLYYEEKINGPIFCTDFSSLIQNEENPFPKIRITDFMVLGPFVLQTDGAFETEYLYERNKVLDCDYLASSGGEASLVPQLGKKEKNDYYSKEYVKWEKGFMKWDTLRFDTAENEKSDVFFSTEQRNCVYYASFYVKCAEESDAVICYEHSGGLLYLNGQLIDNQPEGRIKGIYTTGNAVAVTFKPGLNHVMFKIRVGYICDGFDFGMPYCVVYPVLQRCGSTGITSPERTAAYVGTLESPREVFPLFAGAFGGDSEPMTLKYTAGGVSQEIEIPAMKNGETAWLRYYVPVGDKSETVRIDTDLNSVAGVAYVETLAYIGYDGCEYLCSNFHFDTTYHQEQRTYAIGAIYLTKKMAELLAKAPEFKAILSEVDYLHPFYSMFPEHRDEIKNAFCEGRAEADCFYNQPNDLTSSGEGFIRNLVYGQLYHRDVLGAETPVYAPGDVFGHCNQLSQICAKGGVSVLRWDKTIWGLDALVHQFSPDGTHLINDRSLSRESAMRLGLKSSGNNSKLVPYVAPYPLNVDTSWQQETITKARYAVFSDVDIPVIRDDERETAKNGVSKIDFSSRDITQHHSGVLLTRTDFKQANRLCENLLITAEKFGAVAAVCGAEYPDKALDKAWRQVLCAQHHDSVTGTNNEISFIDLMIEYREAAELAADMVNRSCSYLASAAQTLGENPVFVFNPHVWKRCEPCEVTLPEYAAQGYALFDENGKAHEIEVLCKVQGGVKAVFTASVPALGFACYELKEYSGGKEKKCGSDCTIENEYYRVTVDETLGGGIVSIYDKKAKREVVQNGADGPANRVVVLREIADRMETQHEIYTTGQKLYSSDFPASVESEKNAVMQKLTVKVKLDVIATVRQEIVLTRGVKRIDLKTVVEDYQSRDDLFTLTFPVDVKGGMTIYDDRCSPHIAGKSKNKLSFQTHQQASYSHSRIVPANQWAEIGPTLTVGVYTGKNKRGSFNVGMTSVIRPAQKELILCGNELLKALTKKAVPVTLFPDTEQHGHHKVIHYNEDLTNTDTRFVLSVDGTENLYENKLLEGISPRERAKFDDAVKKNGYAVMYASDSDNIFKKPIDVVLIKASDIETLNAAICALSDELANGNTLTIKADVCASELSQCDDYGVAVINNGTISCSVEGENMLNMMLFHTADFYGNIGKVTGGNQLIPEQKTHSFAYALYPHSGTYSSAEVYKKALEFNDPLFALSGEQQERKEKLFAPNTSFASCDGSFIVTSIKAGGYPLASMKANCGDIASRGLVLRGFEPDGVHSVSRVKLAFDINSLEGVNLLEEEGKTLKHGKNGFDISVDAHSIETYKIGVAVKDFDGTVLGAKSEPVQPVYVRSWEHDSGSMPMGYMAVAGLISKKIEKLDERTYRLSVSMANNHPDARICGEMRLLLPKGFEASKTVFPYDVEENGIYCEKFTVTKPSADAKGVVELRYTDDGQEFCDMFEFGYFNPAIELEASPEKIVATVINNTGSSVQGELSLATPFETWSCGGFNRSMLFSTSPRTLKIELDDGERKEYTFNIDDVCTDTHNAYWAAVKLMVNGRIHFGYCAVNGERHNKWTHEFWGKAVEENNGSLEKILTMN